MPSYTFPSSPWRSFRAHCVTLTAATFALTFILTATRFMDIASSFHTIRTAWDGEAIDPSEYVHVRTFPEGSVVWIEVEAPFFKSPASPPCPAGESCPELWNYEVVEVFFLGDKDRYLEIELCPYGQYIGLLLNGVRNVYTDKLVLTDFVAEVSPDGKRWRGKTSLPSDFFAPGTDRFNAYAIHGEGDNRVYRSLFPATKDANHTSPDFHRLEFFGAIDDAKLQHYFANLPPSKYWGNLTSTI
eukprot:Opistho-2@37543